VSKREDVSAGTSLGHGAEPDKTRPPVLAGGAFQRPVQRYFNLMLLLAVPVLPLLSRAMFRGARYNLAEHAIFNVYVYAQQNLFFVLLLPLFLIRGDAALLTPAYALVMTAYYVWAAHGFFGYGPWATVLRGGVVMVLFTVVFLAGTLATVLIVAGGGGG
jgi:hypothetical protein